MSRKKRANFRGKHSASNPAAKLKARLIGLSALGALLDIDDINAKTHAYQEIRAEKIRTEVRIALHELHAGPLAELPMSHLASAGNMTLVLAEMGLGIEYLPSVLKAQETMAAIVAARNPETGLYSASAAQWATLAEMVSVHEGQLESPDLTDALVHRASKMVHARKLCGDAYSAKPLQRSTKSRAEIRSIAE